MTLSNEERQLMQKLLSLWRDREQLDRTMDETSDSYDRLHGEGAVRELFARIGNGIALKREQQAGRAITPEDYAAFLVACAQMRKEEA